MRTYIHQRSDWPNFYWDEKSLSTPLSALRLRQGKLLGRMEALGLVEREETMLEALTQDVVKSSEIEGETLDLAQVRSSIARRLGLERAGLVESDRGVDGIVEMTLEATQNYAAPLTARRLFDWHHALFAAASTSSRIKIGAWRDDALGPMQVVSGAIGRERVHYEAPAASRLEGEMADFFQWANQANAMDPLCKAGLAHFWFVTIHPFDDGNGRIARAIADWALARGEKSAARFYSMSAQICQERKQYYEILESAQKGSLDITVWMEWFLAALDRAIEGAQGALALVFRVDQFWKKHALAPFNERQRRMLNRLLKGFKGKLTSTKWALITRCSHDTAQRDIMDLIARGVLVKSDAGGRSTRYWLSDAQ